MVKCKTYQGTETFNIIQDFAAKRLVPLCTRGDSYRRIRDEPGTNLVQFHFAIYTKTHESIIKTSQLDHVPEDFESQIRI